MTWEDQRLMCDSPGPRAGHGGARSCACNGDGGSGRLGSPACGVRATPVQQKGSKELAKHLRSMGEPMQGSCVAARRCRVLATARLHLRNGGTPACDVLAAAVFYRLRELVQKEQEVGQWLTEGLDRMKMPCRGFAGDIWRGDRYNTCGQVGVVVLRAPKLHESTRGGAVDVLQGSGRSEIQRW